MLMREDALEAGVRTLDDAAGLSVTSSSDFDDGAVGGEVLAEAEAVVFDELAVALVDIQPDQIQALSAATAEQEESAILAIEPERVVYALQDSLPAPGSAGLPVEFLRGYRDAVNHLTDRLLSEAGVAVEAAAAIGAAPSLVESTDTWGLQVTRASASRYSGEGLRVAVLDTGIDELHRDFTGRSIETRSFVPNQAVHRTGTGTARTP